MKKKDITEILDTHGIKFAFKEEMSCVIGDIRILLVSDIDSLIEEIKQEQISNNERNYALKVLGRLKERL